MKKIISSVFVLFFLFSARIAVNAQSSLPSGYGKIKLGMSVDEVKSLLKNNPLFGYHGDRDVSLLPGENRVLIETDAKAGHVDSFLDRCWFQFSNDKLYIITLTLNRDKIDHYSVFTTLCDKYGKPESLNPEKSTWKNSSVTMSLERPLTLKYVDNVTFENLSKKSNVDDSIEEMTAKTFLEGL